MPPVRFLLCGVETKGWAVFCLSRIGARHHVAAVKLPTAVLTSHLLTLALAGWLSIACTAAPAENPAFDAAAILASRAKKDDTMRNNPQSPFKREPQVMFAPLKYFPPSAAWVFRSKLQPYAKPEAVTILDTKGRQREGIIYGFLTLEKDGRAHTLRVYRMKTPGGGFHHAVWFTDRTTGDTTYQVGRYLDFEKVDDPEHVYTLDFNLAYNPYCAYTSAYGCAIPRKEDRLDLAITAGEKKWHE